MACQRNTPPSLRKTGCQVKVTPWPSHYFSKGEEALCVSVYHIFRSNLLLDRPGWKLSLSTRTLWIPRDPLPQQTAPPWGRHLMKRDPTWHYFDPCRGRHLVCRGTPKASQNIYNDVKRMVDFRDRNHHQPLKTKVATFCTLTWE